VLPLLAVLFTCFLATPRVIFSESKEKRRKGMLAKLTSKNQITIPKKVLSQLPKVEYFEVDIKEGAVVLKPITIYETDTVNIRNKMKKLGLSETSVAEAVKWARKKI
jgi:bifunctional DNA-binding transcriptional regulator/antitoxin component of YhaV-PrlF toxin-antitoxin module